jgi:hypothetical protein
VRPGYGAPAAAWLTTGCRKATVAPIARIAISATSSTLVTIAVARKPECSSTPEAATHSAATTAPASGESANCGATSASVYVPAGTAVATIAKMFATMRTQAAYAPAAEPNAARTHEYDEPAVGKRSPSR